MGQKKKLMSRKEKLEEILNKMDEEKRVIVEKVFDEILFLEEQLAELTKLPFIKIHPENPAIQKPTIAAKQYKELSQVYSVKVKILLGAISGYGNNEDDPVKEFMEEFKKKYEKR